MELHSKKVSCIMKEDPHWMIQYGTVMITLVLIVVGIGVYLII